MSRVHQYISELSNTNINSVYNPVAAEFKGRQAYALSDGEDFVINQVKDRAKFLFEKYTYDKDHYAIEEDRFGNLYITIYGKNKSHSVAAGSHADSVRNGGLFDGLSGVASALYFLEKLVKSKQVPEYNFKLIVFRSEEASPVIARPCLGSTVATGQINDKNLGEIAYGLPETVPIKLKDHIISRTNLSDWEGLVGELNSPILSSDEILLFLELHPSQGRLLSKGDYDLGIVVKGIGGMQNTAVEFPKEIIKKAILAKSIVLTFKLIGRADHTGSALHNSLVIGSELEEPERIDALIESAKLVNKLLEFCDEDHSNIALESIRPSEFTGYTTVPNSVDINLIINPEMESLLVDTLNKYLASNKESGIKIEFHSKASPIAKREGVSLGFAAELLQTSIIVEKIAKELAYMDQNLELGEISSGCVGGLVRATITDFALDLDQAQFKMNLRKADLKIGKLLEESIWSSICEHLHQKLNLDFKNFAKITTDVPPAMVPNEVSEKLIKAAKAFGYKYAEVPSMPAHDAAILGRAGIPIGMIFVTDTGGSHVPTEHVTALHMEAAVNVQHSVLADYLGISLE